MRKTIIGLAMATTMLATPAMARDDSWYVELDAGGMKLEDTKFDVGTTVNAPVNYALGNRGDTRFNRAVKRVGKRRVANERRRCSRSRSALMGLLCRARVAARDSCNFAP